MTSAAKHTPRALESLDRRWFEGALRDVTAGATVDTVAIEPVMSPGAAGEVGRVRLTYGSDARPGPVSVIAKFRGTSDTQQAMDQALGIFVRERRFYAEIAPLIKVAVPACYFAGDGDSTPLLLEDLCELRMGDQVEG
ncbi:MAG: ecdysteroid 22-kinase family protein, partial [Actinomycetota bacterium]|nr:ecdysteroid 22-kinase family protein [Actinomycetota bacterium]